MTPSPVNEACVKRLLDLLRFYVRADVREEVQRVVVPYVRTGYNEDEVTDFLTLKISQKVIRHGFYKLVKELRRGKCDAESAYEEEFLPN